MGYARTMGHSFWHGVKWWRGLLALTFAGLGCETPPPQGERPLEVLVATELTTLDPRLATRALDVKLSRLVHSGLVGLDPADLTPRPLVAESWRITSTGAEIQLRPGLRFHSGRPLSAKDVCMTLQSVADPALASPHRGVVSAIARCDILDETRIRLTLREPRATLLTDLELPILRSDQASLPLGDNRLDGLGPFAVSASELTELRLVPAETGVQRKPTHAVTVRTVRDENARALRLMAGRADVAESLACTGRCVRADR
jgi:MarR-like DNA-binding transcriptional regulator SgrR of sgrS sRNA